MALNDHAGIALPRQRRICITPVRNEAWIIDRFLAASRRWATDLVVADQGSTDGTLQRLAANSDVTLVINDSDTYDEHHRQRMLIDRARQMSGRRVLIALDADEALSANYETSEEWRQLDSLEPGTVLRFRWVNILPGFVQAWIPPHHVALGFVDDGAPHTSRRIHGPRVPQPSGSPTFDFQEIVVLHFQYVAWERMISKQRWYQAWEHINSQQKRPLQIFRDYHHMCGGWNNDELHAMSPEWLDGYTRDGINFRTLSSEPLTWWDREVLEMLIHYGPAHFRKLDIWDKDWRDVAERAARHVSGLSDPRTLIERSIHRLLKASQRSRSNAAVRAFEHCLRLVGW